MDDIVEVTDSSERASADAARGPLEAADSHDRGLLAFRPIRQRKAADEVVTVIVDAIRGGIYEVGDKLPREADLASRLEVSRTTLREAIDTLRRAGIVSVKRGNAGGMVVRKRSIPAGVLSAIEGDSQANMRSLLEVRRPLELTAALLAAQRVSTEEFLSLRVLVERLDDLLDDLDEFIAVDLAFHVRIAHLSGNAVLADYVTATLRRYALARAHLPVGHVGLPLGVRLHRETYAALATRDPARIVLALDDHLGRTEEHYLGERLHAAPREMSSRVEHGASGKLVGMKRGSLGTEPA
jgi:DNA-binding FadR family transcriptional regulator